MEKADDLEMVNANMVPPLLEAVLLDYNRNVPDAREAEVLNVMTTIIHKLHVSAPFIRISSGTLSFVNELQINSLLEPYGRQSSCYYGECL